MTLTNRLLFSNRLLRKKVQGIRDKEDEGNLGMSYRSCALFQAKLLRDTASYTLFAGDKWGSAGRKITYSGMESVGS